MEFRVLLLGSPGISVGCFANNFKCPDKSEQKHRVLVSIFQSTTGHEMTNLFNCFQHMLDPWEVVMRHITPPR